MLPNVSYAELPDTKEGFCCKKRCPEKTKVGHSEILDAGKGGHSEFLGLTNGWRPTQSAAQPHVRLQSGHSRGKGLSSEDGAIQIYRIFRGGGFAETFVSQEGMVHSGS